MFPEISRKGTKINTGIISHIMSYRLTKVRCTNQQSSAFHISTWISMYNYRKSTGSMLSHTLMYRRLEGYDKFSGKLSREKTKSSRFHWLKCLTLFIL